MTASQRPRTSLRSTLRHLICRLVCDDDRQPPKPEIVAFVPGEICILADYPPDLDLSKQKIVELARSNLADRQLPARVDFTTARVAIIRGRDRTLANVVGFVPELRERPEGLLRLIRQVHKTIAQPPIPGRTPQDQIPGEPGKYPPDNPRQVPPSHVDQAETPAALRAVAPADAQDTPPTAFRLRAASANWLSSGALYIGRGGPGARPIGVPAMPPDLPSPKPWEFTLPPGLDVPGTSESTRLVEVAILDSVPSYAALQAAHAKWVAGTTTPHPLLLSLLSDSAGAFDVVDRTPVTSTPGTNEQLEVWYSPAIADIDLAEHQYTMSSHGLFVAGIVRSIAPNVKLRLIQVLNDDAGGALQNLLDGFELLTARTDTTPLLVNCSLVLNVTPEVADLQQLMQDIFAVVNQSNAAVIAAAGNTSGFSPGARPGAAAPAAFDTVTGVGALMPDNISPADYSNVSDTPSSSGFAVFGGAVDPTNPLAADPNGGILGVFIDDLPGPLPNASGWARWAGTSFATPIVTAALANILSRTANTDDALATVGNLLGATPNGAIGDNISVVQGVVS